MSNSLGGNAFTRNICFDLDPRSHEALPSTSCDLCICKVWSCYSQWLRRCIYKKIRSLTLTPRSRGTRSQEMLPSTFYIMWPICTRKVLSCYIPRLRRRCIYKKIHFLTFTGNVAQCPLHLCTYKVWKGLGEDAFTRKYIIWPLGQGHTKCCPVSSTSYDLFSYKVWNCYV